VVVGVVAIATFVALTVLVTTRPSLALTRAPLRSPATFARRGLTT
jgi:hypothetical protein